MIYKVKDLIEALSKYDPESYVGHKVWNDDYTFIESIKGVVEREVEPDELGSGFRPCHAKMVIIDESK